MAFFLENKNFKTDPALKDSGHKNEHIGKQIKRPTDNKQAAPQLS
jgi:hypothetical protein